MSELTSVVIVGASLAGLRAAQTLRGDGFEGDLTIIGDEALEPYDRPPLSKQVLAGEWEPDRVMLADVDKIADLDATWHLGVKATALDLQGRIVEADDGTRCSFDGLIIATGARARNLPGTESMSGVHTLRSLDDAMAIRSKINDSAKLVVVGAGFIGAEVAASARMLGADVTIVEAEEVPFARVLGAEIGSVIAELHREEGAHIRAGVGVERVVGEKTVTGVALTSGELIEAEIVVVGIGVIPNTEWLEGSGLELDDGVVCDVTCLAAPGVVAAGDVARWPNVLFGESMRVEHWDNAVAQGMYAARRLMAGDEPPDPFAPAPWFWTDQYAYKIQLAGRPRPDDELVVVDGSLDERRFSAIYGRDDRITGVVAFGRPRQVMGYRGLIQSGASWSEALDASF